MAAATSPRRIHPLLLTLFILITLGVGGFFAYKYLYIYTERRKYDQASVAIQKVANELRAQGIETSFSKGCGRTQEVYGSGSISCSTGINLKEAGTEFEEREFIKKFEQIVDKYGFKIKKSYLIEDESPLKSGYIDYDYQRTMLGCSFTYSPNSNGTNLLDFGCGGPAKFKLF